MTAARKLTPAKAASFGTFYAAKRWNSIKTKQPPTGVCLIFADYNGMTAADVAYYNGKREDGTHWWTLANVEIEQRNIVAWAKLELPRAKE